MTEESIIDRINSTCKVINVSEDGVIAECGSDFDKNIVEPKKKLFRLEDVIKPANDENIKRLVKKYDL